MQTGEEVVPAAPGIHDAYSTERRGLDGGLENRLTLVNLSWVTGVAVVVGCVLK
jgi:hypothetical protein